MEEIINTLIELIKVAFNTQEPWTLVKVFNEQVESEASMQLRKKANEIIAVELNCNFVADNDTAIEAMDAYVKLAAKDSFWMKMKDEMNS